MSRKKKAPNRVDELLIVSQILSTLDLISPVIINIFECFLMEPIQCLDTEF